MAKDYLAQKAEKRKSGQKALWLLIILLVIVVSMVIKITLTGSLKADVFNGMPTSDEAYTVAKEFVRPTLKSSTADFNESRYQFAKEVGADSVYIIKSSVDYKNASGEKVSSDFKIILKYNGGEATREKNWSLVSLDVR